MLMVIEVVRPSSVYVDESIQDDKEAARKLYAVTAYIASFESWIKAEEEWQRILAAYDISAFHATDFLGRWGEFRNDWVNDKRNQFMERLCAVAAEHTILGVGCGITDQDYEAALPDSLRDEWRSPYNFCVYGMLSLIRSLDANSRFSLPKPLYFLFDNRPKFEGEALRLYREYQGRYDPEEKLFGDVAFGSRLKYKPLQIADLLVHVVNRRFKEMARAVPPEESKMKKPLDILMRRGNVFISFPTKELMQEYQEFAQRSPLQA
jgi:hypothetical protein